MDGYDTVKPLALRAGHTTRHFFHPPASPAITHMPSLNTPNVTRQTTCRSASRLAHLAHRTRRSALGTLITLLAALAGTVPAITSAQSIDAGKETDTPFVTTPQNVVDAMLDLAQMRTGDTLIDLGSGDGRIVITAAKRFGVPGLGVDIDPRLVQIARASATREGVADKTRFEVQDLFDTDLTQASVITLYLLPDVNELLKPRLLKLKAGTRVVSHEWDMGDWKPEREIVVDAPGKIVGIEKSSRLFLWVVR